MLARTQIALGHYPCGPKKAASSELVCPNVGWSNAIPAAKAKVDLTIGGEKLCFTGIGYHDKNWGIGLLQSRSSRGIGGTQKSELTRWSGSIQLALMERSIFLAMWLEMAI